MNMGLKPEQVEALRTRYPAGTKVVLDYMKGEARMTPGLKGKVEFVDDIGQIHVSWENGSSLALNTDVDMFHKEVAPKQEKGDPSR